MNRFIILELLITISLASYKPINTNLLQLHFTHTPIDSTLKLNSET